MNNKQLKKLIELKNEGKTWEEIGKVFKITGNAAKKTYYRNFKSIKTHIVIPDCQVKPGVSLTYLSNIGRYIANKKPDVIVCIGDFADMESLSSYDKGKKSFEGRRYKKDLESVYEGMKLLMSPIKKALEKDKLWKPRFILTLGNHEERILRCINDDSKLDGTIGIKDLKYEEFGWEVVDYLNPVVVDGIAYCHYFTSGVMNKPVTSAKALVAKKHQTCVMGHQQNWDLHRDVRADGTAIIGLMVGSAYTHDEDYLGPQGNTYSRQIWVLHEVNNGEFLPKPVSLDYLEKNY